MSEFFHAFRQVFNGRRPIDDKLKYRILGAGVAFVHLTFALLFQSEEIMGLCAYNFLITAAYAGLSFAVGVTKHYRVIFISSYIEILFHSIVASVLLGWDWGFMLYTMALVPITFYLAYTIPQFQKKVHFAVILAVLVLVCNGVTLFVTSRLEPRYIASSQSIVSGCYLYNTFLAFLLMLYTSILFALEIRYMQHNLEKENRNLGMAANYDPLTHMMNRRSMVPYLEQAARSGSRYSLVMMDIDDFKKINDTYGHSAGDEVLVGVAGIVASDIREEDRACRWGGEEFLLLLKTDRKSAARVASRICSDISRNEIRFNETIISVTATLGVAQAHPGDDVDSVIARADEKLYLGKKTGKNQVVYSRQAV